MALAPISVDADQIRSAVKEGLKVFAPVVAVPNAVRGWPSAHRPLHGSQNRGRAS